MNMEQLDNFEQAPMGEDMLSVSLQCDREGLGRLFLNIDAMRRERGRAAAAAVDDPADSGAPADAFVNRERSPEVAELWRGTGKARLRLAMARLRETAAIRRVLSQLRRQPDIVATSASISISKIEKWSSSDLRVSLA